jgi:hypothetical protein
MTRAALLKFTVNELGVYRLTPHESTEIDCNPLDPTERMTLEALCNAVNDGQTDDAVYAALRANLETLEAIEAFTTAAARTDAARA